MPISLIRKQRIPREASANSSSLPKNKGTCLHSFTKTRLAFMLVVKMTSQNYINDESTWVTNLVPTRSRKLEIRPMSIISRYRIDTVLTALQLIGA